jgi:prefoldin subunit 5
MRAYSEPQDTVQFQVAIEYLNQEKNKISTVRTQMKSALENAKNVLNK